MAVSNEDNKPKRRGRPRKDEKPEEQTVAPAPAPAKKEEESRPVPNTATTPSKQKRSHKLFLRIHRSLALPRPHNSVFNRRKENRYLLLNLMG